MRESRFWAAKMTTGHRKRKRAGNCREAFPESGWLSLPTDALAMPLKTGLMSNTVMFQR